MSGASAARLGLHGVEALEIDDDLVSGLIAANPDGILLTGTDGRILLVNERLAQMFGYATEELIGRPVEILVPADLRDDHVVHHSRFAAHPVARPMGAGLALHGRRKDGTTFPVDISLMPFEGVDATALACVRDISERVSAEKRVFEIAHLLGQAAYALFIADVSTLRFTYVNDAASLLCGYAADELYEMTMMDLDPTALSADDVRKRLDPVLSGDVDVLTGTGVFRRKDGVDIPVEVVTNVPAPVAGRGPQLLQLASDITERLRAEDSLRRSAEELRVAEERDRIARDLHDTVIQRLFAAGMTLQAVTGRLTESEVVDRLDAAIDDIDETIREIRTTIFDVQTRAAGHMSDFQAAIIELADDVARSLGFRPRLQLGAIADTPDEIAAQALPVLREALTNVAKHAHASHVDVIADHIGALWFELRVLDDGLGVGATADTDVASSGHGVPNMTSRAEDLGGTCSIDELASGGTSVTWRVPLPRGHQLSPGGGAH